MKKTRDQSIGAIRRCFPQLPTSALIDVGAIRTLVKCTKFTQVTYDNLRRLSEDLGTTEIYFSFNEGWDGTEVTPGDPAEFAVLIDVAAAIDERAAR